jgi:DNA-directed RNA polymerase subunit RPC12/RpoP
MCHARRENQKEYHCEHCGTTFVFIDAHKKEVVRDTRRHSCPICGRPVRIDKGFVCKKCGKEDLCGYCVEEIIGSDGIRRGFCKECVIAERSRTLADTPKDSYVYSNTPKSFLKRCTKCGEEIPIASESCPICHREQI